MVAVRAWVRWRRRVFGAPHLVAHDGPRFTRLLDLAGTAPAEVARMVTTGVRAGDPVAAWSIAVLAAGGKAPEGSVALLRDAASGAAGPLLVRVAQALRVLTGDESWADPIVSVLASDLGERVRFDAATALADFAPTPRLVEALSQAARDPEYLVRYHAADTLRRYAGHDTGIADLPEVLDEIARTADDETTPDRRADWDEVADRLVEDALRRCD
ncbi:HEAT repeat domain-containing protein [Actinosynnema sp. NPDC002837]